MAEWSTPVAYGDLDDAYSTLSGRHLHLTDQGIDPAVRIQIKYDPNNPDALLWRFEDEPAGDFSGFFVSQEEQVLLHAAFAAAGGAGLPVHTADEIEAAERALNRPPYGLYVGGALGAVALGTVAWLLLRK